MKAGAAAVQITPLPEHLHEALYLGGYGGYRARQTTGVHDNLFARALALADGEAPLVIVALDLVGLSHRHQDEIQRRAARETGVPSDRILIACTHSHASPDFQGLWGGVPGAYAAYLRRRAVGAIAEAVAQMGEATGVVASTQLSRLVKNRRGWDHTDTDLVVLQFRRPQGPAVATLVNYACHPTVTTEDNLEVSCDFPRYLVDAVEATAGGVAIFVNGAQGDANPATTGDFAEARRMGEAVAEAALSTLDGSEALEPPFRLRSRRIEVPLGTSGLPRPAQLLLGPGLPALGLLAGAGALGRLARRWGRSGAMSGGQVAAAVAMIAEQKLVGRRGRAHVPTRVAAIDIGANVRGVTAPGEALTRLALPLKEALGSRHRLFFGLTYDTLGYLVPPDEWMTGRNDNYEETVSLGRAAAPTVDEAWRSLARVPT